MQKRVTSPESYGVKVEIVRVLYGEYQIGGISGDDRRSVNFTWQIR